MLDKTLFWVVLAWMIGMLVMAFIAVREVWRDASKPQEDEDQLEPSAKDAQPASGEKSRGT
jgi:TRAP-type C4-dicarboxylate transport system permease small subunit